MPRRLTDPEVDAFFQHQLESYLSAGERVIACAYLPPVTRSTGSALGGVLAMIGQRAAFLALTDRRLLFIYTPLGVWRPVLENVGFAALDRAEIAGVGLVAARKVFGQTLLIERRDGLLLAFQARRSSRYVATQRALFTALEAAFAPSAAIEAAAAKAARYRVFLVVLAIVLWGTILGMFAFAFISSV